MEKKGRNGKGVNEGEGKWRGGNKEGRVEVGGGVEGWSAFNGTC
jgi:hypothetical protein